MKIRDMSIGDYTNAYALWLSCPGIGLHPADDSREGIARFLDRNPKTCFVAEADGRLIGTIMAGNDGRRGYIYHTAVHPNYRGRGIGSALVQAAIQALERLGIGKAALVVLETNADGNVFWEKQGFTVSTDLTYRNKTLEQTD